MIQANTTSQPLPGPGSLIAAMLDEQQDLSAVERFATHHEFGAIPEQEKLYRELLPLTLPTEGQQLAFEVDLDSCSGCKSCVAACHNLNGLDDDETWRDVGLLQGGPTEQPVIQTITSACHHCLEPACMSGCPVNAYDKDEVTGIVKHLDDQCIGCQYCILKCPYDVPKYNKKRGIVRKCDMCSSRLEVGEAPACVQSCPTKAIRITTIDQQDAIDNANSGRFLPGAPNPSYTRPTTIYRSQNSLPQNMTPADHHSDRPQHAHMPLVIMLVLTQMSVGAFVIERLLSLLVGGDPINAIRPVHAISALILGLTALAASTLHLGRPLYAFRAIIGIRTSWLSREILIFGAFAKCAIAYAAVTWLLPDSHLLQNTLGLAVAFIGIAGVFCSVMIYHDTRRVFWKAKYTGAKFTLTSLMLGLPTALATSLMATAFNNNLTLSQVMGSWGYGLLGSIIAISLIKLTFEATLFRHLRDTEHTPLKRSALLMTNKLSSATINRFAFGFLGGVILPLVMIVAASAQSTTTAHPIFVCFLSAMMVILCLLGELSERYLFFTAVVSPKMPGGVM